MPRTYEKSLLLDIGRMYFSPENIVRLLDLMHENDMHALLLHFSEDMGVGKAYICMILNGRRTPPNAEERLYEAFDNALKKREGSA